MAGFQIGWVSMEQQPESKWDSRKLAVAILTQFIATGLLVAGIIAEPIWLQVTMATVVAYLGSQAWVDRDKNKN